MAKAKKGSPPKRRSVLMVFDWTPEVIGDWLVHGQPYMDDGIDLFPSESATTATTTQPLVQPAQPVALSHLSQ